MQKSRKKQPVYKDRAGRFQISIWNQERAIDNKTFLMDRPVTVSKACIQYSQYNYSTQSWDSQRIWCLCSDIRKLIELLDRVGQRGDPPSQDSRES